MHSGLARPCDALQGFIAHQARASNPEPSQPPWAERGDFAATLVPWVLGRAARWRSRAALLADAGADTETPGRLEPGDAVRGVGAVSGCACCPSGLTHIATGSAFDASAGGRGEVVGGLGADSGASVLVGVAGGAGIVDGRAEGPAADRAVAVVDDVAGAATCVVATRMAGADPPLTSPPRPGNVGRLKVHAPQANATTPMNASDSAALR